MDNLQTAMGEAQWARLEREKRPYRVLSPAAPGAVAYWLAMAMFADHAGGRTDLVQASLDAAREAVSWANGTLTLLAPTVYARDWCAIRLNRAIEREVSLEAARPVRVVYVVGEVERAD